MLKNSDVEEIADRFGELCIDQGDIEYASAKIAVEKLKKANCFYYFLTHVLQTSSVFLIFFKSASIYKLKGVPELFHFV